MKPDLLTLRRGLIRLTEVGHVFRMPGDFTDIQSEAAKFCRAKKMTVRISRIDDGAEITRIKDKPRGDDRYPGIASLKPGESVVVDEPLTEHQNVRVFVSNLGRRHGTSYRCTKLGDAIEVTRIDGAENLKARPTKYNLDRLAEQREIRFEIARADQSKLRLAVSTKARLTGWTIRCRLQDDGTMLVYRTDAEAPPATQDAAE